MQRIVLTFGFISGAMLGGMMLITFPLQERIGFDNGALIGYTTMVLAFLMVFFGVRSYRDNVNGGSVTFGRAFKVGILITAIGTFCYVATWEFYFFKVSPDFGDKYAAHAIAKAKKAGASEAEVAKVTTDMNQFKEMYKNPLINIAFTTIEPLPVGLLFTLIAAGVLSRKRKIDGPAVA